MLYYKESFNSVSSSLGNAVSTNRMKIGFKLPVYVGKMYSIVVKSGINSAGSCAGAICEA